MIYQSQQDKHT